MAFFKKTRIAKALGHIGKNKASLNLRVKPLSLLVSSDQMAYDVRLKVERGKRKPEPTGLKRIERSVNKNDIKIIPFTEQFDMECTYFFKDDRPEDKTLNFILVMASRDGKNPIIFEKEINLTWHFGAEY